MKRAKFFTLIELLIVIAIIGILITLTVPVVSGGLDKANALTSQANLSKIGKCLQSYQMEVTQGWYPCAVGYDDNGRLNESAWKRARTDKRRSTVKTIQTIWDSEADMIPPIEAFVSTIDRSIKPPRLVSADRYAKFTKDNVSYHYVKGSVKTSVLGQSKGIMRDLNEGFDKSKTGYVLFAGGSVKAMKKVGKETSDNMNYKKNWYNNIQTLSNYRDFDSYNSKINQDRPDSVN